MTQLPLELRALIDVQKSKALTGSVLNHVINLASTTGADKERLWDLKKAIEKLWEQGVAGVSRDRPARCLVESPPWKRDMIKKGAKALSWAAGGGGHPQGVPET